MNDPGMTASERDEPTGSKTSVTSIVNRIAGSLGRDIGAGDLAALRRLDPEDPASPEFWRIMAAYVPSDTLPQGDPWLAQAERRWAIVLNALAILAGLHERTVPLGVALAGARYSELRFVRLLRARDAALADHVRSAARYLAAKGQGANCADLARLVFSESESVRRKIARDYYYNMD